MTQFDFYDHPAGLLLDVQADLLNGMNTRMVVPLLPLDDAPKPATRLNPVFTIGGLRYAMVTQFMASIPCDELRNKAGSLGHEHFSIKAAIDILFDGI
jgi:toxin CcdB